MTSTKKKFNFFDLSDDQTFSTAEITSNTDDIPTKYEKFDNEQLKKTNDVGKDSDSLYPKVEEFVYKEHAKPSEPIQSINQNNKDALEKVIDNIQSNIDKNLKNTMTQDVNKKNNVVSDYINNVEHSHLDNKTHKVQEEYKETKDSIKFNNDEQDIRIDNRNNLPTSNISDFFEVKEKLDIKTNIYIKSWIYEEINKIHKETNKSRSAVINKLLEFALKGIKND